MEDLWIDGPDDIANAPALKHRKTAKEKITGTWAKIPTTSVLNSRSLPETQCWLSC